MATLLAVLAHRHQRRNSGIPDLTANQPQEPIRIDDHRPFPRSGAVMGTADWSNRPCPFWRQKT